MQKINEEIPQKERSLFRKLKIKPERN